MRFQKRIASFRYAFRGLNELFKNEPNAQIHAGVLVLVVMAGVFFRISRIEWLAVLLCIALVLSLEAMNTAIERLTDLVSPGKHPLAGKAKDLAAGAVLLAAMGAIIVGLLVFLPRILARFTH